MSIPQNKRILNWVRNTIPATPDKQLQYKLSAKQPVIDLTTKKKFPPIYDQGYIGACTANVFALAFYFILLNNKEYSNFLNKTNFEPSRLWLYYQQRLIEGNLETDAGAQLYSGIIVLKTKGLCSERLYPYIQTKYKESPELYTYIEAINYKLDDYRILKQNLNDMKASIQLGNPFFFGIYLFKSKSQEKPDIDLITKEKNWILPYPTYNDDYVGGHAITAVGYDDDKKLMKIRNSWGENWGDKGHFYLPYEYILDSDFCADFYVISSVIILSNFVNNVINGNKSVGETNNESSSIRNESKSNINDTTKHNIDTDVKYDIQTEENSKLEINVGNKPTVGFDNKSNFDNNKPTIDNNKPTVGFDTIDNKYNFDNKPIDDNSNINIASDNKNITSHITPDDNNYKSSKIVIVIPTSNISSPITITISS